MIYLTTICFSLKIIKKIPLINKFFTSSFYSMDAFREPGYNFINFIQILNKYYIFKAEIIINKGYSFEEHKVLTDDDYILSVY